VVLTLAGGYLSARSFYHPSLAAPFRFRDELGHTRSALLTTSSFNDANVPYRYYTQPG
jgi:hypothetical protein